MFNENTPGVTSETDSSSRCGGPDDERSASGGSETKANEKQANAAEPLPNTARGGIETSRG